MKKAVLILFSFIAVFAAVFIIAAQTNGGNKISATDVIFDSMHDKNSKPLRNTNSEPLRFLENPLLVVKKRKRSLELYDGEKLIKVYNVGLGFAPVGDKEIEGDGKTPEGEFYIFTKNAKSRFYLSLGVSYPSIDDAERGFRENIISKKERDQIIKAVSEKKTPLQKTKLGGEIYIHGGSAANDWTEGCVALADEDIKELFDILPLGAKIKIEP